MQKFSEETTKKTKPVEFHRKAFTACLQAATACFFAGDTRGALALIEQGKEHILRMEDKRG